MNSKILQNIVKMCMGSATLNKAVEAILQCFQLDVCLQAVLISIWQRKYSGSFLNANASSATKRTSQKYCTFQVT